MKVFYYISKILKKIQIPAIKSTTINPTSKVCSLSHVVNSTIDKYSYIGNNCTIINVEIGRYCSIADNCIIGGASHPIDWVSSSPVFHEGRNILKKNFSEHQFETTKRTVIENDVWIGNNVLIKSGVKISNGAVIGMGSVVTKDVGPYEIWVGTPAKLIRKRFNDEIINDLMTLKWWDWEDNKLEKNSIYFNNIETFLEKQKGERL